jgi:hypothetical protein
MLRSPWAGPVELFALLLFLPGLPLSVAAESAAGLDDGSAAPLRRVHVAAVRLDVGGQESLQLVLAPLGCKARVALETERLFGVDLKLRGACFKRRIG